MALVRCGFNANQHGKPLDSLWGHKGFVFRQ